MDYCNSCDEFDELDIEGFCYSCAIDDNEFDNIEELELA